jgi:3-dehydroquinate dehydratase/shikimate dehydrogenase
MSFVPLEEADPRDFELLVHATPLGLHDTDPLPFELDAVSPRAVVVDMVYRDRPTALVEALQRRGVRVVEGREVLLHQAFAQFRLMTGHELPSALARRLLSLDPREPGRSPREGNTRDCEEGSV